MFAVKFPRYVMKTSLPFEPSADVMSILCIYFNLKTKKKTRLIKLMLNSAVFMASRPCCL